MKFQYTCKHIYGAIHAKTVGIHFRSGDLGLRLLKESTQTPGPSIPSSEAPIGTVLNPVNACFEIVELIRVS